MFQPSFESNLKKMIKAMRLFRGLTYKETWDFLGVGTSPSTFWRSVNSKKDVWKISHARRAIEVVANDLGVTSYELYDHLNEEGTSPIILQELDIMHIVHMAHPGAQADLALEFPKHEDRALTYKAFHRVLPFGMMLNPARDHLFDGYAEGVLPIIRRAIGREAKFADLRSERFKKSGYRGAPPTIYMFESDFRNMCVLAPPFHKLTSEELVDSITFTMKEAIIQQGVNIFLIADEQVVGDLRTYLLSLDGFILIDNNFFIKRPFGAYVRTWALRSKNVVENQMIDRHIAILDQLSKLVGDREKRLKGAMIDRLKINILE